ncbi:MAG TPA: glutathione S-transferase family protein [Candidatus Binataceae bacterium]|nr:glutathione S-transferase family protein [Candidatus Binataceae bacterium]
MMRLYQFAISPFCAKVRKILDFKGIDYEAVEVDYVERTELVMASGQMQVPALTLDNGDTIVDSERIAMVLEEASPEPTIFPEGWRGVHLGLARYFDTQLEDVLFRAAIPDELAYYRRRGVDREALWRLIRERKYGDGFVELMLNQHTEYVALAHKVLASLEESLADRAFILGRIGYADFALYGQLTYLAVGGNLTIPSDLPNLRAFFDRMDRITSNLAP